jgi:hypothetical protein
MYFLYTIALYSTGLDTEIGGRSRGFRLEYEVFRSTVHEVSALEPRDFFILDFLRNKYGRHSTGTRRL